MKEVPGWLKASVVAGGCVLGAWSRALPGNPAGGENVATPHARLDGRVVPVPFRDFDDIAPAGAMLSSAGEMASWLGFHLSGGR